ncbi:sugar ABC transporter ATP-binding protein [Paenibacillus sp. GSMTC-2017]|uniref:sugar ABC transporter ATP-binding protein n=1 Tax=Paenibacillus sp. GSMTC-2017 TaxID=2794350 RepID=UPI0018DA1276|nr:sugar ABC transporter ATP-binding protein [Paenibacillus sp. GSMTC-2017]MBH5318621.1 sugar ABC transporter ATP-binding protein [Paenibacillus sp. GSMTC-2017]
MRGISIAFPGVQALADVNFYTDTGKSHALIGANGAGKSTLMKVLAGAYSHYTGEIWIDGKQVHIRSPRDAKLLGIQVVYQEVDTVLIPNLSVGENIMLEHTVHGMKGKHVMHWKTLHQSAQEILDRLNVKVSTKKLAQDLTLAEKQMVLIARSVSMECRFLILDEPTAPLSHSETEQLFHLISLLKSEGVGVIFISHRLPELYEICDDITIMRDGKFVIRDELAKIEQDQVVEYMLGSKLEGQFPKRKSNIGDVCFEAKHIDDIGKVNDVTLKVHKGEIVGLAGLVGAGKTELCRALFGASTTATGETFLNGVKLRIYSPFDAVQSGIALVPEERRREGVFVHESVDVNLTASSLSRFTGKGAWLKKSKERSEASTIIRDLGIKTPNGDVLVGNLSGGNQQKVAIGKWLLVDADVYIFDEPTKGVDVGAKRDIYNVVAELAARGKSILYASSEMSEMMGITDRMYVMYDGAIMKELVTARTNEEEIMLYSTGGLRK